VTTQEAEEIINTKRSLISKWHTEPKFLQQMEALRTEFSGEILRVLTSGRIKGTFADARHYSGGVKKMIIAMCDDAAKNGDGNLLLQAWHLVRSIINNP